MKKQVISIAIMAIIVFLLGAFQFVYAQPQENATYVPILMYHNFWDENHPLPTAEEIGLPYYDPLTAPGNIHASNFEKQLQWLYDNGWKTITLDELYEWIQGKRTIPPRSFVITIDDGYQSVYTVAYPIIKKFNYKANVFVVTSYMTDPNKKANFPHMTVSEMQKATDVFTYGSHTHDLHMVKHGSSLLFYTPSDVIKQDIERSRNLLHTDYFAYPYGGYDANIERIVKEAGYKMAFTTGDRYAYIGQDIYAIPRFDIVAQMPLSEFIEIMNGNAHKNSRPLFLPSPKKMLVQ